MADKELTYADQVALLQQEPPASALATRPGGSGMTLTYLEGYYVIQHLNEVFGENGWNHHITELNVDGKNVYAIVRLDVSFADQSYTSHTDVGSTTVKGTDVENAVKTAVTDALKRAARCLGPAFGNSLYDKDNPLLQTSSRGSGYQKTTKKKATSKTSTSGSGGKESSFDASPQGAPDPNGPDGTYVCETCGDQITDSNRFSAAQYAMFSFNQDGRIIDWNCRRSEGA